MAYDKETGTITTNGDRAQFEKDMFSHFAHVEAQVAAELKSKQKKNRFWRRIDNLGRTAKISIVVFVAWTIFVCFRTADSYEVLGVDLDRWDDDYFILNWLIVPAVIVALIKAGLWAIRAKKP